MVAPATSSAAPFQTLHVLRKIAWPRTFLPLHPTSRMAMVGFRNESSLSPLYIHVASISIYIWMNWYRFYESEREPNKWRKKKSILFSKYTFLSLLFPFPIIIQPIDKDPIDTFSSVYSLTFYSRILKNKKQKIAKSNSTHDINHQFTLFAVTQ